MSIPWNTAHVTAALAAAILGTGCSRPAPAASGQRAPEPSAAAQTRPARTVEGYVEGEPIVRLLPRDAIPSVDSPDMVPAAEAGAFMRDEEPVLGVFDGRQARAYSTWHLDKHEIVNDRLGDTPIAATW